MRITKGRGQQHQPEENPSHSITSSARASNDCGIVKAERLGGLQVDHQLEFGRLLDRQVGGLGALAESCHIRRAASNKLRGKIGAVSCQSTGHYVCAEWIDYRKPGFDFRFRRPFPKRNCQRIDHPDRGHRAGLKRLIKRSFDIGGAAYVGNRL